MIEIKDFAKMMDVELNIVQSQTEGLSHSDSLVQPQPGGNCMNWVLGHLCDSMVTLLEVLGGEKPSGLDAFKQYGYRSKPVLGDSEGVVQLPTLVKAFGTLTEATKARLADMNEQDFEQEIELWSGKVTRGYAALFNFFHISYHVGQLEFGRNLAGKTEKVI